MRRKYMAGKKYQPGESYKYQLIIKHILETPLFFAPDQQIIYRDKVRLTYRMLMSASIDLPTP
jgi:fatty-acyl-CoA synthase